MSKNITIIIMLILISLIIGCNEKTDPPPSLAVYLVKVDSKYKALNFGQLGKGKYVDGKKVNLTSLDMEKEPLFTDEDIVEYDWGKHEIKFSKEFLQARKKHNSVSGESVIISENKVYYPEGGSRTLAVEPDEAWVMVLEGEVIYAGGFPLPVYSSKVNPAIGIRDSSDMAVQIWCDLNDDDPRNDRRVYGILKTKNKLVE